MEDHLFMHVQAEAARRHHEQMDRWHKAMEAHDFEEAAKHSFGGIMEQKERESDHCDALIKAAIQEFSQSEGMTFDIVSRMTTYAGRIYGPRILWYMDHFKCIDAGAYPRLVSYVWGLAEFPGLSLSKSQWMRLWRRAGFTIDGVPAERPTEPITLYRGSRASHKRGFAWTDDIKVGRWFVTSRYGNNHLYKVVCPPDRLLARIHEEGRGESEWIIDAKALPIVELDPEQGR